MSKTSECLIVIRAWNSSDNWWIGSDERLRYIKKFKSYGIIAKLSYLHAKIFYDNYVVEIEKVE